MTTIPAVKGPTSTVSAATAMMYVEKGWRLWMVASVVFEVC